MSRIVTVLALLLLAAAAVFGQAVAIGSVSGGITDQAGGSVAGATVLITETEKATVHTATSDADGHYNFPNLPVGPYRLEVRAKGFKDSVQTGIVLQVAQNITQNVVLQVGALTETVEVHSHANMVETKDTSISQVISQQPIVDLPLNGRNPADLLSISGLAISSNVSGMTLNGGDLTGSKNIQGSAGSGQYSIAGGAANGVNFLLDGGDNNDAFSNVNLPIPFPDALQEFSVQTAGLPAQYGLHPGGVVNIVTKSGTNAFHGDIFEFLRNGDLNARQEATLKRDTLKRSQFGGTAGGRIIKDKLFFFGGYQGTRQRSDPANNNAWVPTAATLQGDFSVVDSTQCLKTARQLKDPSGKVYPGNKIPLSSFDAAGLKLASSFIPLSTDPCGKTYFGYPSNNPDDQYIGRVDYNLSDKNVLYARYFLYDFTAQTAFDGHNALTTGTPGNLDRSQTATFSDSYTISPTMVNSFHGTFDRRRDNRSAAPNMFSPGDLGVNMYLHQPNYTQLTLTGYSGGGFNVGCGTCALANFDINTYQVADDFLLVRGRHEIAVGFDGRKDQFNSYNNQQSNGQFTFNGGTTGDGLADLLIGHFSGLTDGNVISDYLRQNVVAAYAQDSFRVTSHFSVNFGVRWEPSLPAFDKYGRGNQFSWTLFSQGWHSSCEPGAPAGLIFSCDTAQDPYGKAFTASHWDVFSPRLGMVWDPKGDGKQTLRVSFSLLHDTTELFYPERWTTNAPYVSSITLTSGQFSNPFANYTLNGVTGDPFPGAAVFPTQGQYISVPPNMKVTYMMQWNLSYQRQVRDWLLTANYLGNVTRHIWGSIDINQAIPIAGATTSNTNKRRATYLTNPTTGQYYGEIQQTDDGGNASYNALALRAEHRMGHNFQVLTNYTWSHCVSTWDFAGELAGTVYQNSLDRANGERGNCGYDHRHVFNASLVAISPGLGASAARLITKDWQISPLVGLFSGNPIQITDGKDNSLSGQNLDRPNVILPSQVYPSQITPQEVFNPAAFALSPLGTFGNLGRNAVYSPGRISWDMAVSRAFQLRERWKLEFRSDFFNIMNHGSPGNSGGGAYIGTSLSSSGTLGTVTSFMPPRIIQLSMKLYF